MNAPTASDFHARQPIQQPEFILPQELSARLGIAVQTLARWRCEGRGPEYLKIGSRRVAYPADAVNAWLQDCKAASLARHQPSRVEWEDRSQ